MLWWERQELSRDLSVLPAQHNVPCTHKPTNTVYSFTMATPNSSSRSKRPAPSPTLPGSVVKQLRSGREVVASVTQRKTKQATLLGPPSNTAIANNKNQNDTDESEDDGRPELEQNDVHSIQHTDGSSCSDNNEDDDEGNITPFTVVEPPEVSTPISSITSSKSTTDNYESPLPRVMRQIIFPKVKFIGEGDEAYARLQFDTSENSMCSLILEHCNMPVTDEGQVWWKSVRPQIRGLLSGIRNNALKAMSLAFTSK